MPHSFRPTRRYLPPNRVYIALKCLFFMSTVRFQQLHSYVVTVLFGGDGMHDLWRGNKPHFLDYKMLIQESNFIWNINSFWASLCEEVSKLYSK